MKPCPPKGDCAETTSLKDTTFSGICAANLADDNCISPLGNQFLIIPAAVPTLYTPFLASIIFPAIFLVSRGPLSTLGTAKVMELPIPSVGNFLFEFSKFFRLHAWCFCVPCPSRKKYWILLRSLNTKTVLLCCQLLFPFGGRNNYISDNSAL